MMRREETMTPISILVKLKTPRRMGVLEKMVGNGNTSYP
jgi:hypothetical protein